MKIPHCCGRMRMDEDLSLAVESDRAIDRSLASVRERPRPTLPTTPGRAGRSALRGTAERVKGRVCNAALNPLPKDRLPPPDLVGIRSAGTTATSPPFFKTSSARSSSRSSTAGSHSASGEMRPVAGSILPGILRSASTRSVATLPAKAASAIEETSPVPSHFDWASPNSSVHFASRSR